MDPVEALALVAIVGGGLWIFLHRGGAVAAPAPPPCMVGGSAEGVGVSLPCSAVTGAIKDIEHYGAEAFNVLTSPISGGSSPNPANKAQLQSLADNYNKLGLVYTPNGGWRGSSQRLAPGETNVVYQHADGTYYIGTLLTLTKGNR